MNFLLCQVSKSRYFELSENGSPFVASQDLEAERLTSVGGRPHTHGNPGNPAWLKLLLVEPWSHFPIKVTKIHMFFFPPSLHPFLVEEF